MASVMKSFMHRRNNSDGSVLPPSLSVPPMALAPQQSPFARDLQQTSPVVPNFSRPAGALDELQQNQQDRTGRSRPMTREERPGKTSGERSRSPVKNPFGTLSFKSGTGREGSKLAKSRDPSPEKPKKTKSSTNLAGLLSRPRSTKNLHKLATDEPARNPKDKENRTPTSTFSLDAPTPIYAQFSSQPVLSPTERDGRFEEERAMLQPPDTAYAKADKPRPSSFHAGIPQAKGRSFEPPPPPPPPPPKSGSESSSKSSLANRMINKTQRGIKGASTAASFGNKTSPPHMKDVAEEQIDPKDIDKHLEAMLDRRNIPENQRYKMRNLNNTIKMEFIRQDWAEMRAVKTQDRPGTMDSDSSFEVVSPTFATATAAGATATGSEKDDGKSKRSRGRSFTLSRGNKEAKDQQPGSPTKKTKGESTLGRHFRSKSSDSIGSEKMDAVGGGGSSAPSSPGFLTKIKLQHGPGDFVSYLRKVQKPELVEVGKLHKLRLLLRNETVAWTEQFIQQGGMMEIVGLLNRILEVEWREEHEDALLHENLLCLKALSTTALALQYLHSIRDEIFPKLINMLFDPERKGPSEFTTRDIVIAVLFTYIRSASPQERVSRAKSVLSYLRDPEPKEDERPVPFVLEMRRERPYRVWCKEVVNVTKEVFWIFLHHLNVVALPTDRKPYDGSSENITVAGSGSSKAVAAPPVPTHTSAALDDMAYMAKYFPQERPLVPAAPYVGGVEWDATNYLASHVELINAIVACTPTAVGRNALRGQLRISGWERCLGGSLRLCKEKFYPGVHDSLRTWVAAAAEDGWDVRDVRYGPPPDAKPSPKKSGYGGGGGSPKKKKEEAPPRLDMPKLELALDAPMKPTKDAWL